MSASTERVCVLCGRAESSSPYTCGPMLEAHGICGHTYCLLFASGLFEHGIQTGHRRWDFPIENIQSVIEEAAQKRCFVCSESGAGITCQERGCNRSFHLPCATEGECITQFIPPFRSYCCDHRPQLALDVVPGGNTSCLICMEPVGDRLSYSTMVCPACRTAWFHRSCIQENAKHAGIVCFVCPACRERDVFVVAMLVMGILIPLSLPSWITDDSPEVEERHSRCDARECLCPGGREQVEEEGPWQLLLCCSCAAEGTHRACSSLGDSTTSWQCTSCTGPSTASSVTAVLGGSSSPSQEEGGASGISPSQEEGGASGISPSQEEGGASSISPSQEAVGASHSSPSLESGLRSTPPGPMRVRDHSRSRRRAQNPYSRPRQHRDRRHSAAPQADNSESSSPGQAATEASSRSQVLQSGLHSRYSGPVRVQDCSQSGHQAQTPDSQPRQHRSRSRRAAPRAESSSPSQEAAGASRSSPALESGRRSTPTGPMRVRDRSQSRRRAQNPYSRPRQHRDRRHSAAPQADSSESSSPRQAASEASSRSRVLQSGRRSRRSGSVRVQDRSRSGRQAQTPDSQPRQRPGRSHTAAPRAESISPSQTAAGASRSATAGNSGHRSRTGPVRVRDRSRLQRRAQRPYSRHR